MLEVKIYSAWWQIGNDKWWVEDDSWGFYFDINYVLSALPGYKENTKQSPLGLAYLKPKNTGKACFKYILLSKASSHQWQNNLCEILV